MINLLPPAARKSVVREYWLRVSAVWLFLLGTGCLIVAVLLLPTYMLIHTQINTLDSQVSASTAKASTFDVSAAALIQASTDAAILTQGASSTPFSHYLKLIETLAGPDITLRDVTYVKTTESGKLTLAGQAATRQSLANFRDALEADPVFQNVNLPISSLIKDRDLLFSLDITIATTTQLTTP